MKLKWAIHSILATFGVAGITDRDLYEVLGVNKRADNKAIKSAYKKIAKKYHPDINGEEDATQIFQEAAYAKEVLLDQEKRQLYDQCGHSCLEDSS